MLALGDRQQVMLLLFIQIIIIILFGTIMSYGPDARSVPRNRSTAGELIIVLFITSILHTRVYLCLYVRLLACTCATGNAVWQNRMLAYAIWYLYILANRLIRIMKMRNHANLQGIRNFEKLVTNDMLGLLFVKKHNPDQKLFAKFENILQSFKKIGKIWQLLPIFLKDFCHTFSKMCKIL